MTEYPPPKKSKTWDHTKGGDSRGYSFGASVNEVQAKAEAEAQSWRKIFNDPEKMKNMDAIKQASKVVNGYIRLALSESKLTPREILQVLTLDAWLPVRQAAKDNLTRLEAAAQPSVFDLFS